MEASISSFWWDSVTGPATVVSNVVSALGMGRSVALLLPDIVPWRNQFHNAVINGLRQQQTTRTLQIHSIDGDSYRDPGDILPSFALQSEGPSWRPYRESLADYLNRVHALKGMLVWVKKLNHENAMRWAGVCAGMRCECAADGLILLECPDEHIAGIHEVRYNALVSEYSSRLLCSSLADRMLVQSATDARKEYVAAMLSRLCSGDVELAEKIAEGYYASRGDLLGVLARVGNLSDDAMRDASIHVWEAQLECLFPIIEAERLQIVDRHAEQLDELCASGLTDAFDNPIDSRYDVEIGTLYWLSGERCPVRMRLRDCSEAERQRISILRDCRNDLAHRHALKEGDVRLLID